MIQVPGTRQRTLKDKLGFAFKYRRGVIVLHVVNFLVKIAFYTIFTNITILSRTYFNLVNLDEFSSILSSIIFGCFLGIGYLLAPLTGFLTDTYFGRYRVLVASTWLMFISAIGFALFLSLVVYGECFSEQLLSLDEDISHILVCKNDQLAISNTFLFLILICLLLYNVFYSGYHANLCLYGAELLEDANETQKHYYFHIYHFIGVLGATIAGLVVVPLEYLIFPGSLAIYVTVPPFSLSIIIILFRVYRKDFDEITVRQNPINQISRTTWLAVKKASSSKTLFTWQTLKLPTSVLDNAKVSQGGRYTVEWVQEVKTFYRLIAIFLSFMWFFAIRAATYSIFLKMGLHMNWPDTDTEIERVVLITFIFQFGNLVALPLIVLLNAVLYKYFRRWSPNMLTSIGIGLGFGLLTLFLAIFLELARSELASCELNHIISTYYGSNLTIFAILPLHILLGMADSFAYATIREFTYAQSPSSMRGLIYGSLQGSNGVGNIISVILILLAQVNPSCKCNLKDYDTCSSVLDKNLAANCWYYTNCPGQSGTVYFYVVSTLTTFVFLSLYVLAARNYRKRLANFRVDEELNDRSAYHHAYKLFTKD